MRCVLSTTLHPPQPSFEHLLYWEAGVAEGERGFACCSPDAGEKTTRF